MRGFVYVLLSAIVVCLIVNTVAVVQHIPQIRAQFGRITWEGIYSCSIFSVVLDSMSATEEMLDEDLARGLLSGRAVKLGEQFAQFRNGGALTWLFGLGRGSQQQVIEMDLFEVLFYYGIFGFAAMLWLYVRLAVDFLKGLFKSSDLRAVAVFFSIGMTVGYLIIAGHVLFSVTSGFYLAFAILYSRVLFAHRPEEILLWKRRIV